MSSLSIPRNITPSSAAVSPITWISVADAAALLKVKPATIIRRIEKGTLKGKTPDDMPFTYDGKPNYVIQLECLPQKLQYRYIINHLPTEELCSIDLASQRSKLGNMWVDLYINVAAIIRDATIIKAQYRSSREITKHLRSLAEENNISLATLYRFLDQNSSKEVSLLFADPVYREDRVPATMCLWSCDLALALFLDKEHHYSQNSIYEELDKKRSGVSCSLCPYHPNAKPLSTVWKPPVCHLNQETMLVPNNRKTINRFLSHIPEQLIIYAREGVRKWKAEYGYFVMRDRPLMPNDNFQGDHHKFDLFVRITVQKTVNGGIYEKEIAIRPTLTAWMDSATGCIVGWVISVMPNSDTIAEALCRAAVVKPGVPFRGLPRSVYVDCGKDYKSKLLEDLPSDFSADSIPENTMLNRRFEKAGLLHALGVETIAHALPYHPQSKSIERLFGTLESKWICKLDGWCRSSVADRPYDFQQTLERLLKTKKLLTLEEFVTYFQDVILPEYHGTLEEAPTLDGWELSGQSMSPVQLYEKLPKARSITPDWQTVSLLKQHMRSNLKVYRWGILFGGSYYQADELTSHVGDKVDVLYHRVQPPYLPSSLTVIHQGAVLCEAFPAERFQMIGQEPSDLALHMDVQNCPAAAYENVLRHIRVSAHAILPDDARKRISEKTQLYDQTYGPATMEEVSETPPLPTTPSTPEQRKATSTIINQGLDFLFGEE